jgi:hypothetical protein
MSEKLPMAHMKLLDGGLKEVKNMFGIFSFLLSKFPVL